MPLSQGEMTYARSWIGVSEADQTFLERFERHYAVNQDQVRDLARAIEESMRSQLTALTAQPSSVSLPGGLTVSTSANLTALREAIKEFRARQSIGVQQLRRPSHRW